MIQFVNSRNEKEVVKDHEAIIHGLANGGGLYTPVIDDIKISVQDLLDCTYPEIAIHILSTLLPDFTKEEIEDCVNRAYRNDKWDDAKIVPIHMYEQGAIAELWHGPTSAFKDVALTILPNLLTTAYQKQNRNDTITILTATSGDTGKAALAGFSDVDNTTITVFYPENGVSDIQKRQMQTSPGKNVSVVAVKGNFDDCQNMVKEIINRKKELESIFPITMSSANSINLGRLLPQTIYYFTSYIQLVNANKIACGDEINFCVPTGNFGNILAGYYAKVLGLPIHKLICASNQNNILTDFIQTGTYNLHREFFTTMSPSMDILISSNLERLLFLFGGADFVNHCMQSLKENGTYTIPNEILQKLQDTFVGYWTSEEECTQTIKDTFEDKEYLIDPHTAVALHAMQQYQKDTNDTHSFVVLSTASPYKFSEDVLKSIAPSANEKDFMAMQKLHALTNVDIPKNLKELEGLEIRFTESIEKEDGYETVINKLKEFTNDKD